MRQAESENVSRVRVLVRVRVRQEPVQSPGTQDERDAEMQRCKDAETQRNATGKHMCQHVCEHNQTSNI